MTGYESIPSLVIFAVLGWIALNAIFFFSHRWRLFSDITWILFFGLIYGALSAMPDSQLPDLVLEPHMVLYVFVPLLVFASTQCMCLFHFKQVLVPATLAGTLGIVISMLVIAAAVHWLLGVPVLPALLFGVIISATDPLAISALFKGNQQVTEDQKLLIEGESILNDGFVVTVAGILSLVVFTDAELNLTDSILSFVSHVIGALTVGIVLGRGARWLLTLLHERHYTLTTNITLALAYGSFVLAEEMHFSGILAVFAAALAYGYKPYQDDANHQAHQEIWEYLDYVANALLFFLLGASVFTLLSVENLSLVVIGISIVLLFSARFISLWLMRPVLHINHRKLTRLDFWLLNFSGARGAVSIALLLMLPADFAYKPLFLTMAISMILFSLIVYPVITKTLLARTAASSPMNG
ncbi:sodium:proton antiporter [Photobacterium sp. GJ3]|uniref:cation:proton antiporter n=1 Tax=Photobacterium sp. GJ3 TaxID=2829502 RepID=UPI001B8C4FE0|nr:sodium:proton antiporter [Photobacterium sp. GJ3]QUJ66304.1 sodium:proton antiporter [Photobacterium sp. GJ3]